jgi:hypothetical protein
VDAQSSRPIQVWDESIVGAREAGGVDIDESILYKVNNRISISGYADYPFVSDCLTPVLTGGVGLSVWARRATFVTMQSASQYDVVGAVIFADTEQPVTNEGGQLLVEMIPASANRSEGAEITFAVPMPNSGRFGIKFDANMPERPKLKAVIVHFLGGTIAGPAESEERSLV